MAKIIWRANDRVWKDDGDPAADGTVSIRLGGTSTAATAYTNIDLDEGGASSFNIASDGYLESNATLYVDDDVTIDLYISATGFNGGSPLTVPNVAVSDPVTTDETSSNLALGNALTNGGFEAWSNGTSFSAVSGSGVGVQTADGWYVVRATNTCSASRDDGWVVGGAPAEARYSILIKRQNGTTSTEAVRLWKTVSPEVARRLRGKSVSLRYSLKRAASDIAGTVSVKVCTGTSESESGDLIEADGFAGNIIALDTSHAVTSFSTPTRFVQTFTLDDGIKEIGVQIGWQPTGSATLSGIYIQDVELKEATDSEEFSALPEAIEFLQTSLTTAGRLFASSTFTDPGFDVITGWDDSAGAIIGYTPTGGITTSTTNLQLDLTYAAVWTGLHTHNRAVDADIINWGNNTTTHDMLVRWTSSGTAFEFTPAPSGSADATKGMGYDVTNVRWFVDTDLSVNGQFLAAAGSVGTPSIVLSDTQTGFYRQALNTWGWSAAGTLSWLITASQISAQNSGVFLPGNGTPSAPGFAFKNETNSGFYLIGAGNMALSVAGSLRMDFSATRTLMGAGVDLRLADTAIAPTGVYSAGYRGAPVVSGNSAYAFPAADAGSTVYHDEAGTRTYTIPANASVAHPIGTMFIIDNTGNSGSAGTITLAITTDTLRRGDGTSGTGSRTIAANQVAVLRKVAATEWRITGGFS